jgi:tetratricopeptide (TPR) repeat protein
MIRLRTFLLHLLLLAFVSFSSILQADELKDISQLLAQGQSSQALDKVNAYLEAKPKDVSGQFLKGVILAEQNKSADAIRIFSSITEKHPELPEPYNNLAVLYAEQGQYDKARLSLEKAIRTHPSYATAHENLGDIYAKMASDAYDKALQLDRSNARAQTKLSMVKELFTSGSIAPPAAKVEDSAKVAVASVASPKPVVASPPEPSKPVVSPKAVESPKPVEIAKPGESKEKPIDKEKPESKSDDQQAVKEAVEKWAKAWSARDVGDYLAAYADDFKTPNGESRGEWEKMRKERIRKPSSIQVEVLNPKVEVDGNRATVAFKQSYRAGDNAMRTSKTLHLRKSGGKWLITQELAKQ